MHIIVERENLLGALGKARSATPSQSTLPVFTYILFNAQGKQLTLTGGDGELFVIASCKAVIGSEGSVCIPPKQLENFIKAVKPAKSIEFKTAKDRVIVSTGSVSVELLTLPAQDYPDNLPVFDGERATITGFAKAINEVDYAMLKDLTRPVLDSVCLKNKAGKMELVAADGFRLAVTKLTVKGNIDSCVIPSNAVKLIKRWLQEKVYFSRAKKNNWDWLSFSDKGMNIITKPIESTFPEYEKLIPKGGTRFEVSSDQFRESLRVIAAMKPKDKILRLQTKKDHVHLSAFGEDQEKTTVEIPAKGKIKNAFNYNYLQSLIDRSGDTFIMYTNGESPAMAKNNGSVHLLMPMRVEGLNYTKPAS